MKTTSIFLTTFVCNTLLGMLSHAAPIASDSFATTAGGNDYVAFTSIFNQNPTVGASGFVGAWGISSTGSMVVVPGGLTHPLTPGDTFDGQLVSFTQDGTVGGGKARNLSREIDYTPVDGTYYMSLLLGKNAPSTRVDLLAGLGRAQHAETGIFSIDGTWIGFVDGGISFFSGPGASITQLLSAGQVPVDETFFALLQYDFTTSGPDTVTATIYNGSSVEVASQAFPGLNLDQTMGRFSVATQDFGPAASVDEWRFGMALSDVMVQPPIEGDFDLDGDVDGADFLAWQRDPTIGSLGDWQANYGTPTPLSESRAAIPEPATIVLLSLASSAALALRKL
ncbi:PEP-CTERM sorting domain-containing protein [Bythopirellula polymerisocia]|uniref:PEP-CTERM protein-sorting domain-containing protein n=1 Tax=Bythopirellula polymerisocia TaxID=2528003 RepID=A0A5C6CVJ0_9BACT|nr:PEP-CTERM sorting domain-containing protein [Bythopirellula polymerisocia]TWU28468.1 hypothetical protein Pla144_17580 [Bythopirellula polymerisocia]